MKNYSFKEIPKQVVNPDQVTTWDQLPAAVSLIITELAELKQWIKSKEAPTKQLESEYIYSITGLSEFLDCSRVTAQSIKNSGKIPYQQIGRKVMFKTSDVIKAMQGHMPGNRIKNLKALTDELKK